MLTAAVALVVLLGLVAAAELISRWWIRRDGYYVLPPGLRMRVCPDPDTFPTMERSIRFDVNADGERASAVFRATQGLYRVLVAGGSQPEGYLLDQATFWPGQLEARLRTPSNQRRLGATHVHVGSIARSGVGSEALDLIFRKVLRRYPRLQLIIVLVGASDVLRWLEAAAPSSPPPDVQVNEIFRCHPEVAFGWKPSRLAVAEVSRRLSHRWLRPVHFQDRACRWIGRARTMRANAKEIRNSVPDPAPMLNHFDVHFRHAIALAKTHADRVLIVRQPWFDKECSAPEAALMWHGAIGQAWREPVSTFFSHDVLRRLMARVDERASEIARDLDVEQLDMRPHLDPSVDTYYDFFHVTPLGAAQFAAVVAEAVVAGPAAADQDYNSDVDRKVS